MGEDSGKFIEKMMELGIGLSMIQQMPSMIGSMMPQNNPAGTQPAPPPVVPEETRTYLAVDNTQAGPFTDEELMQLIRNGLLLPGTLVWRPGMGAWTPASQVPEVNKLFIVAKLK